MIRYPEFRDRGWQIGSGPTESQCKLCTKRLKGYHITRGEVQLTFWVKIENATPDQMKMSIQGRRNGALADVLQADRDRRYYNKHHNPGDPIQTSWNFDLDIEERQFPAEYPDEPPLPPTKR